MIMEETIFYKPGDIV
jgi:uncharacterized protein YodC (DUF2158 family)